MNRLCFAPALRPPPRTLAAHRIHPLRAYSTPASRKPSQTAHREPPTTPVSALSNAPTPASLLGTPLASVPSDGFIPDLMEYDKLLDEHSLAEFPPTERAPFANRVIIRNECPMVIRPLDDVSLLDPEDPDSLEALEEREDDETTEEESMDDVRDTTSESPLTPDQVAKLHVYPLITRRVTQQTGKGKIHSMYCLVVVGDGNGLVGYGEGKDQEAPEAREKALAKALRSMDYVERFETRTFWTEIESKFGSTKIILRPRPVGFGLRCNPNIHQVLKAAGIKDASAKVWGSRNPLMVIKGLFRMLQAGHAPLSMGDGIGGGMRRLDKGSGLRGKSAIERDRGRKMMDLRTL